MMEIPLNANVRCADGSCGRSTHFVIHLQAQQITHLVVATKGALAGEYSVPIKLIVGTAPNLIRLSCAKEALTEMMPFVNIEWNQITRCHAAPLLDGYTLPKLFAYPSCYPVKRKLVPPDHLAVGQRTQVTTTYGRVGRVEKLLIHPAEGRITRLVLRTGRPWSRDVIIVPFWRVARIAEKTVSLDLDSAVSEALPATPVCI